MGGWYAVGLTLGVALGLGVILSGLMAIGTVGAGAAILLGTAIGAGLGVFIGDAPEAVAGAIGGLLGALAAAVVVRGAMRRGATRLGVGAYLGVAGLLVVLVALIPIAGYVEAVLLPALAARMRGREAARFAGLRTLAK
jgi:hypothetical protein